MEKNLQQPNNLLKDLRASINRNAHLKAAFHHSEDILGTVYLLFVREINVQMDLVLYTDRPPFTQLLGLK